jgi:hypothetical protein
VKSTAKALDTVSISPQPNHEARANKQPLGPAEARGAHSLESLLLPGFY